MTPWREATATDLQLRPAVPEHMTQEGGATMLWFTSWVHHHQALAFYARRGYTDCGLTHFTFEGESHANRVYAK